MPRRSHRLTDTSLRLALSVAFHVALLVTLPGDTYEVEPVDVELVPISAELLRSQSAQVGEPSEPPAPPPTNGPQTPPPGAVVEGPMPPPGQGTPVPPPAPPQPTNSASPRTRGLAAKLPANVRFAVIVRPKMLEGSPHEEAARETIRRSIGMRMEASEDPDAGPPTDPLEGLDELVVVTQNPFQRGNFAAAAAGRKGAPPPPGYDKKGRDLVRAADPSRPSKVPPPPRFPWRQRLLAISDPLDGPRPVVALVGNDVDALTFGNLRVPVPPRIDLAVFETAEHGSIARANAHFDSVADAAAATEAWKSALDARCGSAILALIGLRDVCRRIEIVQEGKTVHGTLAVDSAETDKLLSLLQATMRRRRVR